MGLGPGTGPLQLVCFVDSRVGCWVLPADPPAPACSGQVGAMIEERLLPAPQALLKGAEGGPLENFSPRWTPGVPGCTVPAALVDVHGALTPDRHPVTQATQRRSPQLPLVLGARWAPSTVCLGRRCICLCFPSQREAGGALGSKPSLPWVSSQARVLLQQGRSHHQRPLRPTL